MYAIYSLAALMTSLLTLTHKRKSLKIFLILSCVIPSSFAFETQVSVLGIYFFEHFYWVALPVSAIFIVKKGIPKKLKVVAIAILIYFAYVLSAIYLYNGEPKYLIRDIRPLITLAAPLLLICLFRKITLSPSEIDKIIVISSTATIATYLTILLGILSFSNAFYDEENRYRYFGICTYLCCAYVISAFTNPATNKTNLRRLAIALSLVVVLISGYRVFIIAVLLSVVMSNIKNPVTFIKAAFLSIAMLFTGVQIAINLGIERITSALSLSGILTQLTTRFSPAMAHINNYEFSNYIFGSGLGTTFLIPWFDYQNLDTRNNTVDSTYITLYVKIGIFSIIYVLALLRLASYDAPDRAKTASLIFCGIIMLTFPIAYHPALAIYILSFYLMNKREPLQQWKITN